MQPKSAQSLSDIPSSPNCCLAPRSSAFLAHWLDARGDAPMPGPDEMAPGGMVSLLPYLRYFRWEGPDTLTFRVWGTALSDWMRMDLTGLNVFDLLPPDEIAREKARLLSLHARPCGFVQLRQVTDHLGMTRLFEFLTLPVAAGPDGGDRMIGPGSFCDEMPGERIELAANPKTVAHSFRYLDLGFGVPADVD